MKELFKKIVKIKAPIDYGKDGEQYYLQTKFNKYFLSEDEYKLLEKMLA